MFVQLLVAQGCKPGMMEYQAESIFQASAQMDSYVIFRSSYDVFAIACRRAASRA
jgi:hypothetical protein